MIPTLKINFITVVKIIKRLFCRKPQIIDTTPYKGRRVLLSCGINNYPDPSNNLNGCINDVKNISSLFANYNEKIVLIDSEVTRENVRNGLRNLVGSLVEGDTLVFHYSGHGTQISDYEGDESDGYDEALYLYDGVLKDDDLGSILSGLLPGVNCLVLLDCCFSGTATRSLTKNRFINLGHNASKRRSIIRQQDMKWTVMSGCREDQTSADAFISGQYNGAFTYYLCQTVSVGQSVKDWFDRLSKSPVTKYQNPTLEGANLDHLYL